MENSTLLGPTAREREWVPAPRYLLRRNRVRHIIRHIQPRKVLGIGCSADMLLQDLANQKFECRAPEKSDARVLGFTLAIKAHKQIEFHAASQDNWESSHSLLMAFEVLEHIENDTSAVALWSSWLMRGTKLVMSVSTHQKRGKAREVRAGHVRSYKRQNLIGLIRFAGLIVESENCHGFPLANILEKISDQRYKKYSRVQADQSVCVRDANTAQGGIDRSADAKWYPTFPNPVGHLAIEASMLIQHPFRNNENGSDYALAACKG